MGLDIEDEGLRAKVVEVVSRDDVDVLRREFEANPQKLNSNVIMDTDEGFALIHWAAALGASRVLKYLSEDVNFNTNAQTNNGETALHRCVSFSYTYDNNKFAEILEILKGNVNMKSKEGHTPVQEVVFGLPSLGNACEYYLERILEAHRNDVLSIDVDMQEDEDGDTLLGIVTEHGSLKCVQALIATNADPMLKNIKGEVPEHLARGEVLNFLKNHREARNLPMVPRVSKAKPAPEKRAEHTLASKGVDPGPKKRPAPMPLKKTQAWKKQKISKVALVNKQSVTRGPQRGGSPSDESDSDEDDHPAIKAAAKSIRDILGGLNDKMCGMSAAVFQAKNDLNSCKTRGNNERAKMASDWRERTVEYEKRLGVQDQEIKRLKRKVQELEQAKANPVSSTIAIPSPVERKCDGAKNPTQAGAALSPKTEVKISTSDMEVQVAKSDTNSTTTAAGRIEREAPP